MVDYLLDFGPARTVVGNEVSLSGDRLDVIPSCVWLEWNSNQT
jgi:hypothetical protein